MLTRTTAVLTLILSLVPCNSILAQQPHTNPPATVQEFPVLLQQSVTAGKTLPGTRIQAKLWVATLLDGKVIPRNAVFSGEVVESVAKTATDPSRVSLRMDSVQWKNGSAVVKVYLTAWYYPPRNALRRGSPVRTTEAREPHMERRRAISRPEFEGVQTVSRGIVRFRVGRSRHAYGHHFESQNYDERCGDLRRQRRGYHAGVG